MPRDVFYAPRISRPPFYRSNSDATCTARFKVTVGRETAQLHLEPNSSTFRHRGANFRTNFRPLIIISFSTAIKISNHAIGSIKQSGTPLLEMEPNQRHFTVHIRQGRRQLSTTKKCERVEPRRCREEKFLNAAMLAVAKSAAMS
ncbi:hypothetical protein V9T40_014849 [Parthenolecanium corni]|uniref:Uncharacterized protein n=1 Tax=Parthenolecanium corni TaxID=536013 RepID=A0AAN9TFX2_9HEMI